MRLRLGEVAVGIALLIVAGCTGNQAGTGERASFEVGGRSYEWLKCDFTPTQTAYQVGKDGGELPFDPSNPPDGDKLRVPPGMLQGNRVYGLKRVGKPRLPEWLITGPAPQGAQRETLQVNITRCDPHDGKTPVIMYAGNPPETTVPVPSPAGTVAAEIAHHSGYALAVPQ